MKNILLATKLFLLGNIIFSFSVIASELPASVQATIFLKTLSYNKSLKRDNNFLVYIIYNPEDSSSKNKAEALLYNLNSLKSSSDKKVIAELVSAESLKSKEPDIIIFSSNLKNMNVLTKYAKDNKIMTWASELDLIKNSKASFYAGEKLNRPKIFVNINNLKAEGHEVSSQLLKLCEIVE